MISSSCSNSIESCFCIDLDYLAREHVPESQQGLLRVHGWQWDTYCQLPEEYSNRDFAFNEDVFPTMAGILKRLSLDLPFKYLYHVPKTEMDESLLWQPQGNAALRVLDSNEYIPSWSWAGWEGAISYREMDCLFPRPSMTATKHIWPIIQKSVG